MVDIERVEGRVVLRIINIDRVEGKVVLRKKQPVYDTLGQLATWDDMGTPPYSVSYLG